MKEYLMMVASAAAAGIVADILNDAFCSRRCGIAKHIRFGITVCIACVIIVPPVGYIKNMRNIVFQDTALYQYDAYEVTKDSLYILEKECEQKLRERITDDTGAVPYDVRVEMDLKGDTLYITEAVVVIEPSDAEAWEEIESISFEVLGTTARTVIKEKDDKTD